MHAFWSERAGAIWSWRAVDGAPWLELGRWDEPRRQDQSSPEHHPASDAGDAYAADPAKPGQPAMIYIIHFQGDESALRVSSGTSRYFSSTLETLTRRHLCHAPSLPAYHDRRTATAPDCTYMSCVIFDAQVAAANRLEHPCSRLDLGDVSFSCQACMLIYMHLDTAHADRTPRRLLRHHQWTPKRYPV